MTEVPDVEVTDSSDDGAGSTPSADETLRHFTADFDVAGIVRRMNDENFVVPSYNPPPDSHAGYAGFQRDYVWSKKQKDRFIESLLLSYPVPGVFLVEQPGRTYLVLDGQQRIRTLTEFVNGTDTANDRVFRLRYASEDGPFANKSFAELNDADRNLLLNAFIQVTVVVPKSPGRLQGVYQLFERINSGGTNLQPQEIRVALYAGSRVDAVRAMNLDSNWRALFGPLHSRMKDAELVLRYLALREVATRYSLLGWSRESPRLWLDGIAEPSAHDRQQVYKAPLNQFLNAYLESLGEGGAPDPASVAGFISACRVLAPIGRAALRLDDSPQVNAAHADAVLVGLSLSDRLGDPTSDLDDPALLADVAARLRGLEMLTEYQSAVRESTSHLASVHKRLELAVAAFEKL